MSGTKVDVWIEDANLFIVWRGVATVVDGTRIDFPPEMPQLRNGESLMVDRIARPEVCGPMLPGDTPDRYGHVHRHAPCKAGGCRYSWGCEYTCLGAYYDSIEAC